MRQTLYSKFITAYIFLGILGTVLISTLGSSLIQKHILEDTGAALYKEAISSRLLSGKYGLFRQCRCGSCL